MGIKKLQIHVLIERNGGMKEGLGRRAQWWRFFVYGLASFKPLSPDRKDLVVLTE